MIGSITVSVLGIDLVSVVLSLLPVVVVPLLLVLFYFDGMVVGKFTPPGALFVGYVAVLSPSGWSLLLVCAGSVVASTLGQWTLYRAFNEERPEFIGIRRRVPYLRRLPNYVRKRVGKRRMKFVTRTFQRFGGAGLCVTNAVPLVRCLMSIPAGLSRYPVGRFLLFSTVGNALYVLLLVAVAKGLVSTIRFLPTP